jgi:hypothetical protein
MVQRQYRCTTAHTSASTVGGVAILNGSNFELYIEGLIIKVIGQVQLITK